MEHSLITYQKYTYIARKCLNNKNEELVRVILYIISTYNTEYAESLFTSWKSEINNLYDNL